MDLNTIIQYSLVGICIAAIAVRIIIKFVRLRKRGLSHINSCCGCSLSSHCSKTGEQGHPARREC